MSDMVTEHIMALDTHVEPDQSGQPILGNYSLVMVSDEIVNLDFGYLDPSVLNAVISQDESGRELPLIEGQLTARITLTFEALQALYRQLEQVINDETHEKETTMADAGAGNGLRMPTYAVMREPEAIV